jgi:hypothetical protein
LAGFCVTKVVVKFDADILFDFYVAKILREDDFVVVQNRLYGGLIWTN